MSVAPVAGKNIFQKSKDAHPTPILLDSPSTSPCRVSFDPRPRIQTISFNNGVPRAKKAAAFEVKDKTLILDSSMKGAVKSKGKKFTTMVANGNKLVLKYRRHADMEADLRALGLKSKTYIENKIIVLGIGYKETEESVLAYFKQFGEVEKVVMEKNKKGICAGKATVTYTSSVNTGQVFRLNGRLLRIERIKKQTINTTRLHISHMTKDMNISKLRAALKTGGFVPKNIRIDLNDGKNRGYGFIEFHTPDEAGAFIGEFESVRELIGPNSFVEFSKEKKLK
ncbi:hypothetical protein PAPHI01_2153 [Pancytospora philotis]|nr:hypothetical protein PAPHI01_2153 [Pancytospora philotis]